MKWSPGTVQGSKTISPYSRLTAGARTFVTRSPDAASKTRIFFFSGSKSRRRQEMTTRTAEGFVGAGVAAVLALFFEAGALATGRALTLTMARGVPNPDSGSHDPTPYFTFWAEPPVISRPAAASKKRPSMIAQTGRLNI